MEIIDLLNKDVAKQIIDDLGGATKVAALIGYSGRKGSNIVQQWRINGIAAKAVFLFGKMLLKKHKRVLKSRALP
jgi:hypothetical protein